MTMTDDQTTEPTTTAHPTFTFSADDARRMAAFVQVLRSSAKHRAGSILCTLRLRRELDGSTTATATDSFMALRANLCHVTANAAGDTLNVPLAVVVAMSKHRGDGSVTVGRSDRYVTATALAWQVSEPAPVDQHWPDVDGIIANAADDDPAPSKLDASKLAVLCNAFALFVKPDGYRGRDAVADVTLTTHGMKPAAVTMPPAAANTLTGILMPRR